MFSCRDNLFPKLRKLIFWESRLFHISSIFLFIWLNGGHSHLFKTSFTLSNFSNGVKYLFLCTWKNIINKNLQVGKIKLLDKCYINYNLKKSCWEKGITPTCNLHNNKTISTAWSATNNRSERKKYLLYMHLWNLMNRYM